MKNRDLPTEMRKEKGKKSKIPPRNEILYAPFTMQPS